MHRSLRDHMNDLGDEKPTHYNSACAAAGQLALMSLYDTMFSTCDIEPSQFLVTQRDFNDEGCRANFHNQDDGSYRMSSMDARSSLVKDVCDLIAEKENYKQAAAFLQTSNTNLNVEEVLRRNAMDNRSMAPWAWRSALYKVITAVWYRAAVLAVSAVLCLLLFCGAESSQSES